jgi:hypothetical protein
MPPIDELPPTVDAMVQNAVARGMRVEHLDSIELRTMTSSAPAEPSQTSQLLGDT